MRGKTCVRAVRSPGGTQGESRQRSAFPAELKNRLNLSDLLPGAGEILLLLFGLSVVVLLAGCNEETEVVEATLAVPVEVSVVYPDSLSETVVLAGVLEAYRAVDVVSEVAAETRIVKCDVGDQVDAGDLLAQLDQQVSRETLIQADAALMSARAQLEIAGRDWARDSTLFAGGDIATATCDNSRFAHTAARAGLLSAQSSRELAARQLAKTRIQAPFAGIVSRRYCEIGTYINPGMPVFRIVDIDSLRLRLGVSQKNLVRCTVGQLVRVTSESFPDKRFSGRIRSISPEADKLTRTFDVEIILANPSQGRPLRDGTVIRATLLLGERAEVLSVPREAVVNLGGFSFLFVVDNNVARRKPVTLGALIDGRYIVETGILPGDRVVIVGMQNLRDGDAVSIENAAAGRVRGRS